MRKLALLPFLLLLASSCQSVPEAGLRIDFKNGTADWKNPKNTYIKGLNAGMSEAGKAFIKADVISSTNDASMVQGVLDANVALSQNLLQALQAIAGMAAKAAVP